MLDFKKKNTTNNEQQYLNDINNNINLFEQKLQKLKKNKRISAER